MPKKIENKKKTGREIYRESNGYFWSHLFKAIRRNVDPRTLNSILNSILNRILNRTRINVMPFILTTVSRNRLFFLFIPVRVW